MWNLKIKSNGNNEKKNEKLSRFEIQRQIGKKLFRKNQQRGQQWKDSIR